MKWELAGLPSSRTICSIPPAKTPAEKNAKCRGTNGLRVGNALSPSTGGSEFHATMDPRPVWLGDCT